MRPQTTPIRNGVLRVGFLAACVFSGGQAVNATLWWDGGNGNWGTLADWSITSLAKTPNPSSCSLLNNNDFVFNAVPMQNVNQSVAVTANTEDCASNNRTTMSLSFLNLGTTTLTLGPDNGQITINSDGTGLLVGGPTSPAGPVLIRSRVRIGAPLDGSQLWRVRTANTLEVSNSIDLNGNELEITGQGHTTISGNFIPAVGSLVKSDDGILTLNGLAQYTGNTTVNGGTLNGSGTISGNVTVNLGGSMRGSLTIQSNLVSAGLVAPGNSAGQLTIDGTMALAESNKLDIELGGALNSQHDLVVVGDIADIGGVLQLHLINGFSPLPYSPISILTSNSAVAGTFRELTGLSYGANMGIAVTYTPNSVDVRGALLGDINLDFVVDGTDFNIWNAHKFTQGTSWVTGDLNGDGRTDGGDFNIWNAHKFTSLDAVNIVPEATGAIQLAAFAFAGLFRRYRNSSDTAMEKAEKSPAN